MHSNPSLSMVNDAVITKIWIRDIKNPIRKMSKFT